MSDTPSNLERYRKDLDDLVHRGERLHLAIQAECYPEKFAEAMEKEYGEKAGAIRAKLPSFAESYQSWYSEARAVIRQLLPDRLADFIRHYEKPKPRKDITYESYRIEDYLQGLNVTRTFGLQKETVVGPDAAIPHIRQQLSILKSVRARFESSLFDIRQLVQADLFDSEIDSAALLAKNGFFRAGGAVAGVVLEKHLGQACDNHTLNIAKKTPTIADYNNALKEADVVDMAQWRFIQHLADIRNLCDHDKKTEPTRDQVEDLIAGVRKTIKTLF
jgi:hypothetical protein